MNWWNDDIIYAITNDLSEYAITNNVIKYAITNDVIIYEVTNNAIEYQIINDVMKYTITEDVMKYDLKNNREINQTALSQYIWELKDKGHEPEISWKIVDRGRKFSPVNGTCQLCIAEAYYINFHPEMAMLNSKNEIFSSCRHKKPALLVKLEKRGRKRKSPGTWKFLISSYVFYICFSYYCMPEESRSEKSVWNSE